MKRYYEQDRSINTLPIHAYFIPFESPDSVYNNRRTIYALSGYECINCDYTSNTGIGIDCEIKIPSVAQGEEIATITVKNNLVTIT